PRGPPRRRDGDADDEEPRRRERRRIGRLHAEEQALEGAREQQAERDAQAHPREPEPQAMSDDQRDHLARPRAERQAQAHLVPALGHAVGDHPVDADERQRERRGGEQPEEERAQPAARQRFAEELVHRAHVDGDVAIGAATAARSGPARSGPRVRATIWMGHPEGKRSTPPVMKPPARLVLACLCLAACGGGESTTTTPDAPLAIDARPPDAPPATKIEDLPITETKAIAGLGDTVEVVRDNRGAPHIYAHNLPDAVRVQGYLMARDRFIQMEFLRRSP